jgi:hypothetical protein
VDDKHLNIMLTPVDPSSPIFGFAEKVFGASASRQQSEVVYPVDYIVFLCFSADPVL